MSGIQKGIGIIALTILAGIGINIYMSTMTSANMTGWNDSIVQMGNSWLPLTAMAVVVVLVVMSIVTKKA